MTIRENDPGRTPFPAFQVESKRPIYFQGHWISQGIVEIAPYRRMIKGICQPGLPRKEALRLIRESLA